MEKAFAAAAERLGPIQALVACSGIGGANGGDAKADRFDDLVATNLNGTYYCCRSALDHLAPGPEPRHLVVLSSILARIPVPGYTGYSAAKAGLLGLVRSFAAELAADNVQVNAICPGWVDTDMAWEGLDGIAAATGGTREDAYREAMRDGAARADVAAGRHRRHRRLAAVAGRPRRHRAGDRSERRRLDGVGTHARGALRRPSHGAPETVTLYVSYCVSAGSRNAFSCLASSCSSSSSVPIRTGPLNQFFADSTHQPPKRMNAPPIVSGA